MADSPPDDDARVLRSLVHGVGGEADVKPLVASRGAAGEGKPPRPMTESAAAGDAGADARGAAGEVRDPAGKHPLRDLRPTLRGVFYSEFDNVLGPKVIYQAPEG